MTNSSSWNYRNTAPKVDFGNPDEMIRANGAAEAARTDHLKEQVEDYSEVLKELRQLYEKNNELVQKLQFMSRNTTEEIRSMVESNNMEISQKLQSMQEWDYRAFEDNFAKTMHEGNDKILKSLGESQDQASQLQQEACDFTHKENVRVYRNVQAAMIEELTSQTRELREKLDAIEEKQIPDPEQKKIGKASFGLMAAVLAVQVLEGIGLIALLVNVLH